MRNRLSDDALNVLAELEAEARDAYGPLWSPESIEEFEASRAATEAAAFAAMVEAAGADPLPVGGGGGECPW